MAVGLWANMTLAGCFCRLRLCWVGGCFVVCAEYSAVIPDKCTIVIFEKRNTIIPNKRNTVIPNTLIVIRSALTVIPNAVRNLKLQYAVHMQSEQACPRFRIWRVLIAV